MIERQQAEGLVPRLLLHVCCAPCSSYCLEFLRQYFDVTVFYYNPNITDEAEFLRRDQEVKRMIETFNVQVISGDFTGMHSDEHAREIHQVEAPYEPEVFKEAVQGLEEEPEGGRRCSVCFALRLRKAAQAAKEGGFDYFTTTLTISPLKDAQRLNRIGRAMGNRYGVPFLPSDFKKKNGFKRSTELSKQFCLYRQDYCGCSFSKEEREQKAKIESRL